MQVENLKAYLANIGMTVSDFGIIIECDPKYLSRIIHGHKIPSRRLAKDIREATSGVINIPTRQQDKIKKKEQQQKQECHI